jgi:predicted SAM-dependent methyltransferase
MPAARTPDAVRPEPRTPGVATQPAGQPASGRAAAETPVSRASSGARLVEPGTVGRATGTAGAGGLWLNVASSHLVLDGFVNLDRSVYLTLAPALPVLRHLLGPGHVQAVRRAAALRRRPDFRTHDCRRPLPYAAGTVDHVLCSHFLEHLPVPAMTDALADYLRVLRPGGTLHVILPDLRYAVDHYVAGRFDADEMVAWQLMRRPHGLRRRAQVLDAVFGLGLEHQWMYDAASARRRLVEAGFEITDRATPSSDFRRDDPESLHLVGTRPQPAGSRR